MELNCNVCILPTLDMNIVNGILSTNCLAIGGTIRGLRSKFLSYKKNVSILNRFVVKVNNV